MDSSPRPPAFLSYTPVPLQFGTSGLRGLVKDITDLEAYINAKGFVRYALRAADVKPGDTVVLAGDLRPSTDRILAAVATAARDAGLSVEYAGRIPTPALTYYAMRTGRASVMVTGSHIPFDRNGIKFNKTRGEVLKADEAGILEEVAAVRREEYGRNGEESAFDAAGTVKPGRRAALPPLNAEAEESYVRRYLDAFPKDCLKGRRIAVYQHSAVGRDALVRIFKALGADAVPAGRSDTFIPIDTENITDEQLDRLEALAKEAGGPVEAVVSTDGDSDRPLLAAVDRAPDARGRRVRFYGGDLLGAVVSDFLAADLCVTPVSANDAVELDLARRGVRLLKTRIGSPYVIQAMEESKAGGGYARITAWEANGGFLTGTDIALPGGVLKALPTRDAVLPLLAALLAAWGKGLTLPDRFAQLPPRFSKAGLLDNFPVETSRKIVSRFSIPGGAADEAAFEGGNVLLAGKDGAKRPAPTDAANALKESKRVLESVFSPARGFDGLVRLNAVDGIRLYFANGDIAHVRPSGNAPQLRIYAVSRNQARADEIVRLGLTEPDGLLRRLAQAAG